MPFIAAPGTDAIRVDVEGVETVEVALDGIAQAGMARVWA